MRAERHRYLLGRIRAYSRNGLKTVRFKRFRRSRGDFGDGEISLDHRDEILSTFVHECLHGLYDWDEDEVVSTEKAIMARLTPRQAKGLFRCLAAKLVNKL